MDPLRGFQLAHDDLYEQLHPKSAVDQLTGLPNRAVFSDALNVALFNARKTNRHVAVIYIDLEGFKGVNDTHGRVAGDNLLRSLARKIRSCLSEKDLLARIGGDEFVIAITDLDDNFDHQHIVSKLIVAASQPIGELMISVSVGIGITVFPRDDADATQLIRHAMHAMYQSKQLGENNFQAFDVVKESERRKLRSSIDFIRNSLRHDFLLHYQPKVNMRTGKVVGLEALIRWMHPKEGLLQPAAFLPYIEDHPISVELGQWVIEAALSQMAIWKRAGLEFSVSVNIGAIQLQDAQFFQRLRVSLAKFPNVDPSKLELEILETSSIRDLAKVQALMQACLDIGITFALDDFGTGYSSLSYLQKLPSTIIKIDQSFVSTMLDNPGDLSIVRSVISLAEALKLGVIAEGVETLEHGTKLLTMGCDLAQGFGIARPMIPESVPDWVQAWRSPDVWGGRPACAT